MTTKHIGYSNPRNFKEKIELLKMKEAASTANFAAAMRDAQEICKIAHAYDGLPLSLDHNNLSGSVPNRSGILKAYSLSNISSTDYQTLKTGDNSNQETPFFQKDMPVDRKDIHGSSVSSSHTNVYPSASNIHDERVVQRPLPSSTVPIKETIPVKLDEELSQKSQNPNVCPFSYEPIGSKTTTTTTPDTSHHLHERNTFIHDTDYASSDNYLSSSWSTIPPTQHSAPKSCLDNWNNECSNVAVVSRHQIQRNFNLFTDTKPYYQSLQPKSHISTNPYLFCTSHSDIEVASTTSLLTQQSSLTNSSQYTCESGYFSAGIGTPVGFRSFPPTNSLQHQLKTPFSANITEQIRQAQTPYSVVDWRRTASDSSIHHTLSDIQLNPIEQYTYGPGKTEKSHILSPRSIMSSDHYFRPACKLRGVEEEETSNILTPMDDTDTKRACMTRRHRDTHLLDNSHFVHTELPTNESHLMPPKRPYTCSTESQSSNGFDTVACDMKMCTPHMDNSGGTMEKKNIDSIVDTALKHHKSWKIRSSVYNPHSLEQPMNKPIYPCISNKNNNIMPTNSKYSDLIDPSSSLSTASSHSFHLNQDNYSFGGTHLHNLPLQHAESHRGNLVNMLNASGGVARSGTTSSSGVGVCGGGGSGSSIQDNTTTDDLFLRNTSTGNNDLDEYLQLPNLICKADESTYHFAGRRDSCTMTAEILSNLASFRDEIGEFNDGKIHSDIIPVSSNFGSHFVHIPNRTGVYNPMHNDDINTINKNIKQKTTHLHNNMVPSDSLIHPTTSNHTITTTSITNTNTTTTTTNTTTTTSSSNNNSNIYTVDRCRLQNMHFIQSHSGGEVNNNNNNDTILTNSSIPTIYSSCVHHVGDKIGISMSPNDYRLLTDPRLINYVTDKETEAKLINQ
ncbi:unnamed protein product [Schistosoma rodhaini]|nr:hypothetical protein Smp_175640 [Schistosoma mansoni]CAH8635436.1 unnamed protein product [Schistosoma rodhaini]|eukprot:XP_018653494.1 hypothetical protein Smp_175640 [Schistosoma mansoni]